MTSPLNQQQFDLDAEDVVGALGGVAKRMPAETMTFGELHAHMRNDHKVQSAGGIPLGNHTHRMLRLLHQDEHRPPWYPGDEVALRENEREHEH